MLLRGTVVPSPKLTPGDTESTIERAGRSGRSHGGVPLAGDGSRKNQFNYSSSGQQNSRNKFYGQNGNRKNHSTNTFHIPTPGWQPPPPPPVMVGYAGGPSQQSAANVYYGRGRTPYPIQPYFNQSNPNTQSYNLPANNHQSGHYFGSHRTGPRR